MGATRSGRAEAPTPAGQMHASRPGATRGLCPAVHGTGVGICSNLGPTVAPAGSRLGATVQPSEAERQSVATMRAACKAAKGGLSYGPAQARAASMYPAPTGELLARRNTVARGGDI